MPSCSRHSGLTWFLLLSCGLHLLLLVGYSRTTATASLPRLGQAVINVDLENAPRDARVPDKIPVRVSHIARETPVASMPLPTHGAGLGETPSDASPRELPRGHEPQITAVSGNALRNQLLGELQTRLARYLTYPPLARERGWQGTVWLGVHVEPNGRLENIRLERSSGYAVLDRSALNSLDRLGYFTEAVAWLNGRSIDVQLPVIYRLMEN